MTIENQVMNTRGEILSTAKSFGSRLSLACAMDYKTTELRPVST